jgi:GTPase Era involved in 16S rRNA processing
VEQFINMATQQTAARVTHGISSCTQTVQAVSCSHPDDYRKKVVFVDTPGFGSSEMDDVDVLAQIARWLTKT